MSNTKAKPVYKGMMFCAGGIVNMVYGGPYRQRPKHLPGIKLAPEIHEQADVRVDIPDFGVPKVSDLDRGIREALELLADGPIYVGCMGGRGRTGLFMAALAKVMLEADEDYDTDPVEYVRENYSPHAVETIGQEHFIRNYNVDKFVADLKDVEDALNTIGVYTKEEAARAMIQKAPEEATLKGLWGKLKTLVKDFVNQVTKRF